MEIRKEGKKATTATLQWDEIVQTMNGAFDSAFPRNEKKRRDVGKTQREKERKYKRQRDNWMKKKEGSGKVNYGQE